PGLHYAFKPILATLFLCAGFTQFINNPISCSHAGGFCHHTCYPTYGYIGTCDFLCCKQEELC
uniref:Beta-defensin n=1 Tax=Chelonoidis abingdonii TaxID=106734 RepID=A0A8C0HDT8_CHEAB